MAVEIINNMSNEAYHADRTAISCSGLKDILHAPAFFYGQRLDPRKPHEEEKEDAARLFGNMVHCALFEHHAFNKRYLVGPSVNKQTKIWKEFKEQCEAAGGQPVTGQERDKALMAREAALRIPDIASALSAGVGEQTIFVDDEDFGVRRKIRTDWRRDLNDTDTILLDGKTYKSAKEAEFGRQVENMDYDMQDAFYTSTFEMATGRRVVAFVFLAIESKYPFLSAQMELPEEYKRRGHNKVRAAMGAYARAMQSGNWEGYGNDLKTVHMPNYLKDK